MPALGLDEPTLSGEAGGWIGALPAVDCVHPANHATVTAAVTADTARAHCLRRFEPVPPHLATVYPVPRAAQPAVCRILSHSRSKINSDRRSIHTAGERGDFYGCGDSVTAVMPIGMGRPGGRVAFNLIDNALVTGTPGTVTASRVKVIMWSPPW